MAFTLPDLPYAKDALAPYLSQETLEYHHDKHHNAYVTNLNGLIEGTDNAGKSLEEIILAADQGPLFNNAAQVWNHTFYWSCMKPGGGGAPAGELAKAIDERLRVVRRTSRRSSRRRPSASSAPAGPGWCWRTARSR